MLCQQNEPEIITDLTEQDHILEMQIYFDYLPSGVLYQLMVKYKDSLDIDLVWADGAKFRHGTDGYTIVRRDGNVLQIYVYYASDGTKQNAVEYMYQLKHDVEEIARVRKATANILQIKIGYLAGTFMEYFDYKQLVNAKQCGVHYVATSGKKPRKIAVQDILDQQDRSRERKTDQLLKDIVVVCTQLQQRAAFMDPQEDVRNNKLLDALKNKEYDISGQVQIGEAPSGKRQNELDFLIRYPEGDPWTIMEALNVSCKTALTYWDKHLNKLVGRYNASWGLTELVLVSYVDCEENNFKTLYEKFRDHMKTFNPEKCRMQQNTFDHCTPLSSESNYLQVDRCTYFRGDQSVTVYHYFARMGENEPPEEKPVD
jgi:hypothetical protein